MTTNLTDIDVDVWLRDTLKMEKSLEWDLEAQRVNVGNADCVRNRATADRTATWTRRNTGFPAESENIRNDEHVPWESRLFERGEFVLDPRVEDFI